MMKKKNKILSNEKTHIEMRIKTEISSTNEATPR